MTPAIQHHPCHQVNSRLLRNPPMPSGKYPPSPTSTQTPTKPPSVLPRPPTYQIVRKDDFDFYIFIWLLNNMEGEHASDTEEKLYREQVEKYHG